MILHIICTVYTVYTVYPYIPYYIYIWFRACYRRSFLQCFHTRLRSLCFCSAHPCRNDDHRGEKKSRAPATLILCTCRPQSLVCFQVKKRRTWARHAKIESCLPQLIHHSTRTARIQSTISQSSWTGS